MNTDMPALPCPKKTRFLLGTNWKMYKTNTQTTQWLDDVARLLAGFSPPPGLGLFALPSHPALAPARALVSQHALPLRIGAQNAHWDFEGEYTGEVSIRMLEDIGVDLVMIGHSERRYKFGETGDDINRKTLATLNAGMTALICVGETREGTRLDSGDTELALQLDEALRGVAPGQLPRVLIAYEPVWAIGERGEPAPPDHAAGRHAFLRAQLAARYGAEPAARVPFLYGGSVNTDNYLDYARLREVDGIFVGRAAWTPEGFATLARGIATNIFPQP